MLLIRLRAETQKRHSSLSLLKGAFRVLFVSRRDRSTAQTNTEATLVLFHRAAAMTQRCRPSHVALPGPADLPYAGSTGPCSEMKD